MKQRINNLVNKIQVSLVRVYLLILQKVFPKVYKKQMALAINKLATNLAAAKEKELNSPGDKFVVGYKQISTGQVLGYHASTFCQLVDNTINAKIYTSPNPERQLAVIYGNLKHVFNARENEPFFTVHHATKVRHFPGIAFEDIELFYEDLELEGPVRVEITFNNR